MAFNKIIPTEITIKILSQLPVKSLSRFKCVSKSWKTLIENSDFYNLHLNQSLTFNSYNCSLILATSIDLTVNGSPAAVPFLYSANLGHNNINLNIRRLVLPPSFQPSLKSYTRYNMYMGAGPSQGKVVFGRIEVAGSTNDLVLIVSGRHLIAVYNSAIEQDHASFKIIPCINYQGYCSSYWDPEFHQRSYQMIYKNRPYSHYACRKYEFRVFGFGYNSYSDCCKIVNLTPRRALMHYLTKDSCSWVQLSLPNLRNSLYDSSSGENQEEKLYIHAYNHGVQASHYLHWNITKYDQHIFNYSKEAIVRFDLQLNEWGEVPLPDELYKGQSINGYRCGPYIIELGELNRCLCLLISRGISYPYLELWILKEYELKESWTKLCNLPNGSGVPLAHRKERHEYLLPGIQHVLSWHSPKLNRVKKVEFHGCEFNGEHCYSTQVSLCIGSSSNPFRSMKF